MISKFLIIISIISSPLSFTVAMPPQIENQIEQWNKYQQSSISSLLAGNPNFLPIRNWNIEKPEINAKAAMVFETFNNEILYQKNIEQIAPIASLTKIVTALVALDCLSIGETVVISEKALAGYGHQGNLIKNEKISVNNLLHALLMESSNDAAIALAEACENKINKNFVDLMNWKAKEVINLKQTFFVDPTGYGSGNISTAKDVSQMLMYSFKQPIIWRILKTSNIDLTSVDGAIEHHWINTNKLLTRLPDIAGGKTGYTQEAQDCLALAVKCSNNGQDGYLITVILGAQDRFNETEKLITWAKNAYLW